MHSFRSIRFSTRAWSRRLALLAASICVGFAPTAADAASATPNIILIVLDDMGWGDPGAYGGTFVLTPHIDQLSAAGQRFTNFYANGSVCSPTRASLLTGMDPQEFGIRRIIPGGSTRGLPADTTTLPDLLATQGYVSGQFGKWHLGRSRPSFLPLQKGFDTSALLVGDEGGLTYWDPTFLVDDTTEVAHTGHLTHITTDYALQFITDNQAGPFFANIWYNAPHFPYEPTPESAALYTDTSNGKYAALITDTDEQIGEIVDLVDSLGIGPDTLIIVTSDNGSTHTGITSNGPYRGQKTDVFDGGLRAPFIVNWPGVVAAGTTNDSVILSFDLLPSIAAYLGIDTSALDLDGQNLLAAIGSGSPVPRDGLLFWESKDDTAFFTPLDGELNRFAVREGDWKVVRQDNTVNAAPFLFDLATDPYEATDVAGANPSIVEHLVREYRLWRSRTGVFDYAVDAAHGFVSVDPDLFGFLDGRVDLVNDTRFDIDDGDFSFQSKITFVAASPGVNQTIAERPGSWALRVLTSGQLQLAVDGPTTTTTITTGIAIPLGIEIDIAFTIFGWRNDNSTVRLYGEGNLIAETNAIETVAANDNPIYLGNSAAMDQPFVGFLRHTRLYLMSLTPEEQLDEDLDDIGNAIDNCPQVANPGQEDTDGDFRGDACNDAFDFDGDEWANSLDNCPGIPNVDQTDTDSDGRGDACNNAFDLDGDEWDDLLDNCVDVPNPSQADTDGDGVGDACNDASDADGDEWADSRDNCPAIPNPTQDDADSDGLGDACNDAFDADGDEWDDLLDNCPDDHNPGQGDIDQDGIGDVCQPVPVPALPPGIGALLAVALLAGGSLRLVRREG